MKNLVINELKAVLEKKSVKLSNKEIEGVLEIPRVISMGNYAFPCFFLSEKLKKSPFEIASDLSKGIKLSEKIEKVEVKGGYLNFFVNKKILGENVINEILEKKEDFGKSDLGGGEKVLIEHTSINPNASPHVGRARNALIGDSVVRLMRFLNFKPEVHYYVNDVSKQIAMLVLAGAFKLNFNDMLKKYMEISLKVKESKEIEKQVFELLEKFEKGDKETVSKFRGVVKTCIKGQEEILLRLGIKYDFFDYESDYIVESKNILELFKKTNKLFLDENKRYVLDLKNTSIEGKMKSPVLVLTRSDKTGLYALRDIAYTIKKLKRVKDNVIVLGEDQKLYFLQIKEALKFLGFSSPREIHYSFILLSEKGKSKKMSTRRGDVVLLEDFLEMAVKKARNELDKRKSKANPEIIGVGAIKYAILKNGNNKIINFDLDEALNFEGNTGPYLLYSYARACSILKKANIKKTSMKINEVTDKETELVLKLSLFGGVVLNSYKNMNPSLIANYSYEVCKIFNEFYHACPVIGSKDEMFRLNLVGAFKQVLENSLGILGIDTLDVM
jgi:arginyl-tRNA synthetase